MNAQHPAYSNPDELLTCPYDPNHRIMKGQLRMHQMKCYNSIVNNPRNPNDPRKKLALSLTSCKYNSTHIVKKEQLKEHHMVCSSRGKDDDIDELDRRIMKNLEEGKKMREKEEPVGWTEEEDWGKECGTSPLEAIAAKEYTLKKKALLGAVKWEKMTKIEAEDVEPPPTTAIPGLTPTAAAKSKKKRKKNKKNDTSTN